MIKLLLLLISTTAFATPPNFHQMNPTVYRSGRPTTADVKELADVYHIKTIIDLEHRIFSDDFIDEERRAAKDNNIEFIEMPMWPIGRLDLDLVKRVTDQIEASTKPVLFHCYRGSERTGIVGMYYRINVEDWDWKFANTEADNYGFSPWFRGWKEVIYKSIYGMELPEDEDK